MSTYFMGKYLKQHIGIALALALSGASAMWYDVPAYADGETIEVVSSSITSEFPGGFRIKAVVSGKNEITSIAVRLRIGQQSTSAYDYLCQERPGEECTLDSEGVVKSEFFWRTDTAARYIPPGTIITYNLEIEDSQGESLAIEQSQFIYYDARFEDEEGRSKWEEVSEGPVTVAYHGPVRSRAEIILETIVETLAKLGPILGAGTEGPIRVTMYNNVKEMLEALPPRSQAISRELITEGQAFSAMGTLLVLGGGRMAKGTASHEVTHILVHRAGDSIFRRVPAWLQEGLAEYANVDPGFSYDIALDFAVATGRLLPAMFMVSLPGDPEDVIIFYGQARSVVRLMINRYGEEKMGELMAVHKDGKNLDDALQEVYGFDRLELDNIWRESIGAPPYVPPESGRALPTPLPLPAILPYSLTPQPGTEAIVSKSDTPTPIPTPEPEPTATPTPEPTATATHTPVLAAAFAAGEATPRPEGPAEPAPAAEPEDEAPAATGAGCAPQLQGGAMPLDLATAGMLFGLAGLGLRRRIKR